MTSLFLSRRELTCRHPVASFAAVSAFSFPSMPLLLGRSCSSSRTCRLPFILSYGSIAGDAWYRAQYMLQDQKIGHYMHIPPRAVFFSQVFGTVLGIPINYAVMRWVLSTKRDVLTGAKPDPLHQWTGQSLISSNTLGV
ncbi:hypothetical protein KXV77_008605, partial [Aspergillus fumigatus]